MEPGGASWGIQRSASDRLCQAGGTSEAGLGSALVETRGAQSWTHHVPSRVRARCHMGISFRAIMRF